MVNRHTASKIRKIHRYLGLFIGIQFLFWTISGLYFSWTNLDEIHGDHFKNEAYQSKSFANLISPSELKTTENIHTIELRDINNAPYYWINKNQLYNAENGDLKNNITEEEALYIAKNRMKSSLEVSSIEQIDTVGKHHEYRGRLLPAYVISYNNDEALKVYVSVKDGKFQTVRHRNWRWFDFLWMTHTMDYEGRDNFNTTVLRAFSLLGLITVLSGFLLWYTTSPSIRKIIKKTIKINT
ncbi:PepSY domain-containing protein [Galbibacter sp. EGI 63066]|uniref:PepSY domain-containing protein n=1 Tax=Galbibacter sp. EGI 63066 TaxID=2993559 RepID=UPI002248DDDF|nr:PepSY domain-containing protein [Galbibacter sp. EGI 63066]MCX2679141.1 PepSY domain-containing protein [Galbibacter sp. EGI 63066]